MTSERRPQSFRASFDQAASDYDALRPGYPAALIADVVRLASLPSPADILEIGCGTGQATMPFARRGDRLICLDIGAALLDIARRKFAGYPDVRFEHAAFEDWPAPRQAFDLVMSATAFHWIAPDVGLPRAARALRASGSLAIFSNEHLPMAAEFTDELHRIEQRLVPSWPDPRTPPPIRSVIAATSAEIDATRLYDPVTVKTYPWTQRYTTAEYVRLLNTYSNYRGLDESTRARMFDAIATLIDQKFDGTIPKPYLALLFLAHRRRTPFPLELGSDSNLRI